MCFLTSFTSVLHLGQTYIFVFVRLLHSLDLGSHRYQLGRIYRIYTPKSFWIACRWQRTNHYPLVGWQLHLSQRRWRIGQWRLADRCTQGGADDIPPVAQEDSEGWKYWFQSGGERVGGGLRRKELDKWRVAHPFVFTWYTVMAKSIGTSEFNTKYSLVRHGNTSLAITSLWLRFSPVIQR